MSDLVLCPECQAAGVKSRVTSFGSVATMMGCRSFYDEEGRRHLHDKNTITESLRCSNGHDFERKYKRPCWCGWPAKMEATP